MLWWDWPSSRRLALLGAMIALAAVPWISLGWLPDEPRAFAGGTAFLLVPQIAGWFLFVGLATGRIPARGGSEIRSSSPTWFWIIVAMYAAVLIVYLYVIGYIAFDAWTNGLD